MANFCLWFKVVSLSLFCLLNIYLFIVSCNVSYQYELTKEHIKFREIMPTMDSWVNSPFGKLKSYLFNVTNAEDFLSGKDKKIRLEQVGPITYHIVGYNEVLNRTDSSITYRKHRYHQVRFMPEESVSPDILNRTIIQFNTFLLGASAMSVGKLFAERAFGAITLTERLFLPGSVYYFLWEFTRPGLRFLSRFGLASPNCAMLYNALKEKEEVFKVNIGTSHGMDNFFRIQSLNEDYQIAEQLKRRNRALDESCPADVRGALDNSVFPPFVKKDTPLEILASESCRILPLHYQREEEYDGLIGYRYSLLRTNESAPECLSSTFQSKLPRGMFDGSRCVVNDAAAAFSSPHFYGTSYNWQEHFEGLNPNAEDHEGYILLEPTTGIPLREKYRFQSSIPMPDMKGYPPVLENLSHMIVPNFWYEFELDNLPDLVLFLMRINVKVIPILQPIFMVLQMLFALASLYSLYRLRAQICTRICANSPSQLETMLNENPKGRDAEQAENSKSIN